MTGIDKTRRRWLIGAFGLCLTAGLSGCARVDPGIAPVRRLVLRLAPGTRHVFWEKTQGYAQQNGLASHLLPQPVAHGKDFGFMLRGKGLEIVCHNNAYDLVQPDDYVISFYGAEVFGADKATIDRYADTFLALASSDSSIHLISDVH